MVISIVINACVDMYDNIEFIVLGIEVGLLL